MARAPRPTAPAPRQVPLGAVAALVALALVATAFAGTAGPGDLVVELADDRPESLPIDPDAPAREVPGGTPAPPEPDRGPLPPVTIAFGGDVHAEPPIDRLLAAGESPLADLTEVFAAADLSVVNVETAVGSAGSPADKQFTFQAPPTLWGALVDAGVDVVSLANNHTLDFGVDGLTETVDGARDAGLDPIGAGGDAEQAYAPVVREVDGVRVAFVGLTRVMPVVEWGASASRPGLASAYDVDAAADAVAAAGEVADHVVAVVHWGRELDPCPVDHQLELADALLEAGAVIVAGHHAHVLQGIEERQGALVAYGLGNLAFYARREEARQTAVLTVTVDDQGVSDVRLTPARIDDTGSPRPLSGDEAEAAVARIEQRSPGGGGCSFPERAQDA